MQLSGRGPLGSSLLPKKINKQCWKNCINRAAIIFFMAFKYLKYPQYIFLYSNSNLFTFPRRHFGGPLLLSSRGDMMVLGIEPRASSSRVKLVILFQPGVTGVCYHSQFGRFLNNTQNVQERPKTMYHTEHKSKEK